MAQWARNPPSPARIKLVFAVVGLCLAIFAIETWIGWPDWMSLDPERVPTRVLR
jgi:hypothetical protein